MNCGYCQDTGVVTRPYALDGSPLPLERPCFLCRRAEWKAWRNRDREVLVVEGDPWAERKDLE